MAKVSGAPVRANTANGTPRIRPRPATTAGKRRPVARRRRPPKQEREREQQGEEAGRRDEPDPRQPDRVRQVEPAHVEEGAERQRRLCRGAGRAFSTAKYQTNSCSSSGTLRTIST